MQVVQLDKSDSSTRLAESAQGALAWFRRVRWSRRPPWAGFGEPFNGQTARREAFDALLAAFEPDAVIETGTFMGFTTRHLAQRAARVFTVEVDPGYATLVTRALRDLPNVTLVRGDSALAVGHLADQGVIRRPLAYLDAHWEERVPLQEELDALFSRWPDAVAVVDDFRVPEEPGYGYDVYGGVPLSIDELSLPGDVRIGYPAVSALAETGSRRGTAYLARGEEASAAFDVVARDGKIAPVAS